MKSLRKKLAKIYMFSRTVANLFRLHELNFARKHLKNNRKQLAIDVACGIGLFTNFLFKNVKEGVGFDISLNNIKIAKHFRDSNIHFFVANAENIPVSEGSFDTVVSLCALEHFKNPEKAITEFRRILKANGQLLLTVDSLENINSPEFIEFHKRTCYVNRYFNKESIKNILENQGFEVISIELILRSKLSTILSICAFKIMFRPLFFNIFSIFAYPVSVIADALSKSQKAITIGIYAKKR